jgi:hypothetical protein
MEAGSKPAALFPSFFFTYIKEIEAAEVQETTLWGTAYKRISHYGDIMQ